MKNIMANSELRYLKNFVGSEYHFLAGPNLWHFLSATRMVIMTSLGPILVNGVTKTFDVEGFVDEYCFFDVGPASQADLNESEKKGNVYIFQADKVIKDIKIFRERITQFDGESIVSDYFSDVAIQFVLEGGSLAISKINHHTELLQATFSIDENQIIPETHDGFVLDITKTHVVTKEVISLRTFELDGS